MNKDDQINLEILSKIIIQLKTSQIEANKKITEEMLNLKTDNLNNTIELREKYDNDIKNLKEELLDVKQKSSDREKYFISELTDMRLKFEKCIVEMREDMLKLLQKYESKFQTQDDEIEVLKTKCEMVDCKICSFQSFKVHLFTCEECHESTCANCIGVCKNCHKSQCLSCMVKCNTCAELICKDCSIKCKCKKETCKDCFDKCHYCNISICKKCLISCRKCEKLFCYTCSATCEKCDESVSCKYCYEKDGTNERCICGKLYCFNCEDDCTDCTIPCSWENETRIFQGFHAKSSASIPVKSLIKFFIIHKGIDTTHLGLTTDSEFKMNDKATDNFWSLCLNSGEKFSSSDYKKKGIPWMKYAVPVKTGDTVYLKYTEGEIRFLINRKEYPIAFNVEKGVKYYLYCLTHDDSTTVEIKSLKVFKNIEGLNKI